MKCFYPMPIFVLLCCSLLAQHSSKTYPVDTVKQDILGRFVIKGNDLQFRSDSSELGQDRSVDRTRILQRKEEITLTEIRMKNNNLVISFIPDQLNKREEWRFYLQVIGEDTIVIPQELLEGDLIVPYNGNKPVTSQLVLKNPIENSRFFDEKIRLQVLAERWAVPVDCDRPPRINWDRYLKIAGTGGALILVGYFPFKANAEKKYDAYREKVFSGAADSDAKYSDANSDHKIYYALTRGGAAIIAADILALGIDFFFFYRKDKKIFDYYCEDGSKVSWRPVYQFPDKKGSNGTIGFSFTYNF